MLKERNKGYGTATRAESVGGKTDIRMVILMVLKL